MQYLQRTSKGRHKGTLWNDAAPFTTAARPLSFIANHRRPLTYNLETCRIANYFALWLRLDGKTSALLIFIL